jgi:hypothetical protein
MPEPKYLPRANPGERILQTVVWLMIGLFALASATYARRNSYFVNDDYDHFQLAESLPLGKFLALPIDVHIAPGHRLFSLFIERIAPLNFDLAVLVLVGLHLLSLFVLWRLLQSLRDGPWNLVILLVCACSGLLLPMLVWWSAGIHRLPYVLMSLCSLYAYLSYRQSRRLRELFFCILTYAIALCFYSKAVLLPACIVVLEVCLSWRQGVGEWRRYSVGLAMCLMSLVYVAWYERFAPVLRNDRPLDIGLVWQAVLMSYQVLARELLLARADWAGVSWVWTFWVGGVLVTAIRRPTKLVYWLGLLLVLGLNALLLGVSNRVQLFGLAAIEEARYYYELLFLVAIFAALILNPEPGEPSVPGWRGKVLASVVVVCVAYPIIAFQQARIEERSNAADSHRQASKYMRNLLRQLDALPEETRVFIHEDLLPSYVYGAFFLRKPFSEVLPLRYPQLRFVKQGAQYRIDQKGNLKPM